MAEGVLVQFKAQPGHVEAHSKGTIAQPHPNGQKVLVLISALPEAQFCALVIQEGAEGVRREAEDLL